MKRHGKFSPNYFEPRICKVTQYFANTDVTYLLQRIYTGNLYPVVASEIN